MTRFQAALLTVAVEDAARGGPCILCGRPSRFGAVFVPDDGANRQLGAPAGKRRCVVYGLCRKHARRRFAGRVEEAILSPAT